MLKLTPPMGWNTWNTFAEKIDEQLIMQSADALIESGLKDAGYEYIVIDDCWALRERDKDGRLVCDPIKFPHGMKYLADYIHSKGLKFGMYSCCGMMTCQSFPSSFNYEYIDAETFASWGVDFLKYDYCYKSKSHNVSSRNIFFTIMSIPLWSARRVIMANKGISLLCRRCISSRNLRLFSYFFSKSSVL